jgi:hypothetical protein
MKPGHSLRMTDAGRGWVRVWNGTDLVAACPSRKAAEEVVSGILAQDALEVANLKIILLEKTLDQQLSNRVFTRLFQRGKA